MRGGFDIGHLFAGIFWLILIGLAFTHWTAVNSVEKTTVSGSETIIAQLENPGQSLSKAKG